MHTFFLNPRFIDITIKQVLKKVPNVGNIKVLFICKQLGLLSTSKWALLSDKQVTKLAQWLDDRFVNKQVVGPLFVKAKQEHMRFLKTLKAYRSVRLIQNLPARGQRTATNAKTVRRISY